MGKIVESYKEDQEIKDIISKIFLQPTGLQEYYLKQGLLEYRGKWVLGGFGNLKKSSVWRTSQ